MRCRTAQRWITRDLAGELAPGRAGRLERHLERCEGCRRERAAYAALDRALGQLPLAAVLPPRLEQDTLRRARAAAADDAAAPRHVGRWIAVTAPVLAAAGALVLALRPPPDVPQPVRVAVAPPATPRAVDAPVRPVPPQAVPRAATPTPAPPPAARPRRVSPAVPSEPPAELAARPDLFINLPLLRNMERMEHYDAITTLDEPQGDQSNG